MIEVNRVTKIYKKKKESDMRKSIFQRNMKYDFFAVDKISFDVGDGEILGFVGPNGAGKSTTIKMMTGILTPTSGEIRVNGMVPYKERKKYVKNIGVVFGQRTQLWWDIPLNETYKLLKEVYQIEDKAYKESMDYLNSVLDLKEIMGNPVRSLSLGQRMKADIAASLLHNPKILFLDEPTIGLDAVVKDKIINSIKEINRIRNITVILTTHDLSDIEKLCNRIVVIDRGEKIYDDDLIKLKNSYSKNKHFEIRLEGSGQFEKLDYERTFPGCVRSISFEENTLHLTVSNEGADIQDVMKYTLNSVNVSDINVRGDDISDIIKQLYPKFRIEL